VTSSTSATSQPLASCADAVLPISSARAKNTDARTRVNFPPPLQWRQSSAEVGELKFLSGWLPGRDLKN
jgi:hypothetical protein